jgi:hypothetical protein
VALPVLRWGAFVRLAVSLAGVKRSEVPFTRLIRAAVGWRCFALGADPSDRFFPLAARLGGVEARLREKALLK